MWTWMFDVVQVAAVPILHWDTAIALLMMQATFLSQTPHKCFFYKIPMRRVCVAKRECNNLLLV